MTHWKEMHVSLVDRPSTVAVQKSEEHYWFETIEILVSSGIVKVSYRNVKDKSSTGLLIIYPNGNVCDQFITGPNVDDKYRLAKLDVYYESGQPVKFLVEILASGLTVCDGGSELSWLLKRSEATILTNKLMYTMFSEDEQSDEINAKNKTKIYYFYTIDGFIGII